MDVIGGRIPMSALKPPQSMDWLDTRYTIHVAKAGPDGFSLFESTSPAGSGPPRHIHEREDETFYVLSGNVLFWTPEEQTVRREGETIFIPRGTEHTFRVQDDGPATMLTVLTPGGFEGFFAEMAAGAFRIPEDMPAVEESARRFHLRFTGPPL
ncbi:cupin domain-containing protein [Pelagibacterium sp. 26DY04]|uniref:cupin domain-containing protein n=1 Tax=Pelagibacterium sp. 26DY04 TaxID=2967130 RepID=UPI0028163104|nr:cupin domain-containing protein [Pelagibacterium sp. 26DY04]WMT86273.1 cupin domain-containing protein [Pelagibacterium sp. 26DY04]